VSFFFLENRKTSARVEGIKVTAEGVGKLEER
jgi:hypothetical protein